MTGSRKSTIACTLLVAAATLVIVVSATRGGFGQQAVIPTHKALSTGEPEGKYVEKDDRGRVVIVFEQVRSIDVRDHWASLEIIENDQLATLMLPRENVKYIKSWPIESDERK